MPDVLVQPGPRPDVTATVAVSPVTTQVTVTPGPRPQAAFAVAVTRPAVTVGVVEAGGAEPPSATRHEHVQTTPLTEWSIPHPFGVIPAAYLLLDSTGQELEPDPAEVSAVRLVLLFAHPTAGRVILSRG